MQSLINTPTDRKNIGLSKLVYALRQELDIYCLIGANVDSLFNKNQSGIGKNFFSRLLNLAISSITLSICKIYEEEEKNKKGYTKYELNSICGVINHLCKKSPTPLNASKFNDFIQKYNGPSAGGSPMDALTLTFDNFRNEYKDELDRFKTFRDKYAAHSEYGFSPKDLPSFDVKEKLLLFGADFCELVYEQFVWGGIDNLTGRDVKSSLKRLLQELGFQDIKTDM